MFVFLFPGLNETSGSNQRNLGMLMFVLLTDSVYCYFLGVQINFFLLSRLSQSSQDFSLGGLCLVGFLWLFSSTHLSPAQKENSEQVLVLNIICVALSLFHSTDQSLCSFNYS